MSTLYILRSAHSLWYSIDVHILSLIWLLILRVQCWFFVQSTLNYWDHQSSKLVYNRIALNTKNWKQVIDSKNWCKAFCVAINAVLSMCLKLKLEINTIITFVGYITCRAWSLIVTMSFYLKSLWLYILWYNQF